MFSSPPSCRLWLVALSSGLTFELGRESDRLLVHAAVVGDHRLRELLHFGVGRLRRRELARVDVDLVGGDDDLRNLRVVDALGERARPARQQRAGEQHE